MAKVPNLSNASSALKWFMDQEKDLAKKDQQFAFHSRPNIGQLYLFSYDPKLKETLPYYDRTPLVFPVTYYSDGFLGMNMHYLSPPLRMRLFNALIKTAKGRDKKKALQISYSALQAASKSKLFVPTIKRYLYSFTKTKFARLPTNQWENAINLPIANFAKASQRKVWSDSRGKI